VAVKKLMNHQMTHGLFNGVAGWRSYSDDIVPLMNADQRLKLRLDGGSKDVQGFGKIGELFCDPWVVAQQSPACIVGVVRIDHGVVPFG